MVNVWAVTSLAQRFPHKTLIQYAPDILGWPLGKIVGLLYCFYFFYVSYYVLQEFATLMGSAYMPRTPSIVFILILGFLAVYSSYGGFRSDMQGQFPDYYSSPVFAHPDSPSFP